jgi:hypothetical protein
MNAKIKIVEVNRENISMYPARCLMNPQNKAYETKIEWLKKRFSEGLKIKQLYPEASDKCIGFIEYTPGEYAWRAVDARGYMFIHCLWVYSNKDKDGGYGSLLIGESIKDAKNLGCTGVAAVTSDGAFMSGKEVFLRNGFRVVETSDRFELLVLSFKKGKSPGFNDWQKKLKQYSGLNIVYSNQCPWVIRSIETLTAVAKQYKLKLKVTEIRTPKQAQAAPSVYAVFSLINNGKLIESHYISETRFRNILKKEILP